MSKDMRYHLDTIKAAAYTGLAVKTLENWRSRDEGPPYYKLGNRIVYNTQELDDWMQQSRVVPRNRVPKD